MTIALPGRLYPGSKTFPGEIYAPETTVPAWTTVAGNDQAAVVSATTIAISISGDDANVV
jgi:hypothetical protein